MKPVLFLTGASGDIGSAIALRFAKEGYALFLVGGKNTEKLKETVALCERFSPKVVSFTADLSRRADCETAAQAYFTHFSAPSVFVHAAGMSHRSLFQDSSDEDFRRVLDTNFSSAVRLSKALVPSMIQKKCGRIVNISSIWGSVGASMEVEYAASKGALNAFTKALAKELAPSGIAVNAVSPGVIDTKMNAEYTAEERSDLSDAIPASRFGTTEEIAETVYLVATAPTYLTGQIITVDGGFI